MLKWICIAIAFTANLTQSNASSVSIPLFSASLKESTQALGRIKSLIKAEYKNYGSLSLSKDLAFPYKVISELLEAVSPQSASAELPQPEELAMYMTASKSVINTLVDSWRSRRVLPESSLAFLDKLEELLEEVSDLSVRLDRYVAVYGNTGTSSSLGSDSEDSTFDAANRRTTTTTTSTPPPPGPPALASISRSKPVPRRTNNQSVPHIMV